MNGRKKNSNFFSPPFFLQNSRKRKFSNIFPETAENFFLIFFLHRFSKNSRKKFKNRQLHVTHSHLGCANYLIYRQLCLIWTCVIRIFVLSGQIGRSQSLPIHIIPIRIIRILPNADRNLGSTSVRIKQSRLYCLLNKGKF